MDLEYLSNLSTLFANLATILGIVLAIILFFVERNRNRKDKELLTYSETNSSYLDYLKMCIDHPELDVMEAPAALTEPEQTARKQRLILNIVVSMLEQAFFLYGDQDSSFKRRQWNGWSAYIEYWCQHHVFQAYWPEVIDGYDKRFVEHMRKTYAAMASRAGQSAP